MKLQRVRRQGLVGFADKAGQIVVPCRWHDARGFHCGRAWVRDERGLYGFIDEAGTLVIPCTWQRAYSFSEDLAAVQDSSGK